ncbi:hypothetical protein BN1708_014791 [Verticillium longisporum]|uniref:Uncharacterized protein n=1 Tax=Verticillium longisporum TaxID=100787 RepID=A0A0G4LZE1_VERLO|nr:hypothetical protein BN1708_014791 [Verticillium longisporum]
MDRPRAGRLGRRKTQPSLTTSFDMAENADPEDDAQNPQSAQSTSPVATFSHQTPQTAPAGRRGARQLSTPFASSSAQTASSPFSGGAASRRKRIRTFGFDGNPDDDDETNKKGSHNLRKRAKIDYSANDFEDELPEIALPAPRTATRRRRAESEVVGDGFTPPSTQRRRANSREFSHTDDTPAGRRKTPAKRPADPQPYFPPSDDVVKDTIEVVGDSSDLHTSDEVSDHESKVESPAAKRKFKRQSATPDGAHARPTSSFERYDRFGNGSQPNHAAQANSRDNGQASLEIAHPQPIHINHVSIITAPQLSQDSDTQAERHSEFKIERLSSRAAHFTSSPRASSAEQSAAGHGVPAVVPTSMKAQSNTQMAAAPAVPSTSSSSLDQSGRGDDGSAAQLTVNGRAHVQTMSESDIAGEADSTERQLAPNASSRHEPSNTQYGDAVENNSQAGLVGSKTHTTITHNHFTNGATQPSQEHLGKSIESDIHGPSTMDIDEDNAEIQVKTYAWSHLTPYVEGEVVLHPEPTMQVATAGGEGDVDEDGDAPDGDGEGNDDEQEAADKIDAAANDDADQYEDEADRDDGDKSASQTVQPDEDNSLQADGLADVDSGAATPLPQTPRAGSPVSASAQQTGANTPSAGEDKSKAAVVSAGIQRMRKQFRFPKLSDPAHYREYLKEHSNMSTEELWAFLAHVNTTLLVWQEEWQKCGRQVDDAENAKRREIQDAEYEKKTANLSQFAKVDSYIEKDFDIRGYRAPIKEKEQGTFHQRWQDRVEAMAYGYEYDPHPSKIGQQDPIAQRDGIMAGRQLRANQAAAAATVVKPILKRRGRPPLNPHPEDVYHPNEDEDSVPKNKPGPKKRGPKGKRATTADTEADTPASDLAQVPPKRKRGRQPKIIVAEPESDAADPEDTEPEELDEPQPKRARTTRKRGKNARMTSSRPISSETVVDSSDESRPTTSSSNATISDDGSTYSFRQNKRQRTSRGEAQDDEEIVEAVQPPKKKTRINFKASTRPPAVHKATRSEAILSDMAAASQAASAPLGDPSHLMTFKHMGDDKWTVNRGSRPSRDSSTAAPSAHVATISAAPSAPHSAASSVAPSQAGDDQDYRLMTKSQKMSASMKKRWLNGSMQNAVNKRKATLAAKKAANAQAAMVVATPAPPQPNGHNPFTNGTQFQQ